MILILCNKTTKKIDWKRIVEADDSSIGRFSVTEISLVFIVDLVDGSVLERDFEDKR